MDYQTVPKTQHQCFFAFVVSLLISYSLPSCFCIVNRDLVLTPKKDLQLSGKRIFYEESPNNNDLDHNVSAVATLVRPWERTLKHVTYLTLFTNAANGIIMENFSNDKEYKEFLTSSYVRSPRPIDSRFGDIATLAQGRVETMPKGTYRFIEDTYNYDCEFENNIIAMWHVQKIRHRDTPALKYHYEMKFSVSPVRGSPNKRTIMEERPKKMRIFIQKEDDYPNSFTKIASNNDGKFWLKKYKSAKNVRHVSPNYGIQQVTPIPQNTFFRGVFGHPPTVLMNLQYPHMQQQHSDPTHSRNSHHHQQTTPLPERLNIGESYKGNYVPKPTSKNVLFKNLLNMFMGKSQYLSPSTTPPPATYKVKRPGSDIYSLRQHQTQELAKFSRYQKYPVHHSQEQFNYITQSPAAVVTHHYHHHFYMTNNSAQHNEEPSQNYRNEVTEIPAPPGYVTSLYEDPHATTLLRQKNYPVQTHYQPDIQQHSYHSNNHTQQLIPPAPQKFTFSNAQIEPQHVHVTPSLIQQHETSPFPLPLKYITLPMLISYPAPINREKSSDRNTPRNKPFLQSDHIEDNVNYSEVDPLYDNLPSNGEHQQKNVSQEQQLESPYYYDQPHRNRHQNFEESDNKKENSESVEAQFPAPSDGSNCKEELKTQENIKQNTTHSSTTIEIPNGETLAKSTNVEASNSMATSTKRSSFFTLRNKIRHKAILTSSTRTTKKNTSFPPSSQTPIKTTSFKFSTIPKPRRTFLPISSTQSSLRTISRCCNSYVRTSSTSTTTTTSPTLKWTPIRKSNNFKFTATESSTLSGEDREVEADETDSQEEVYENEEVKAKKTDYLEISKPSLGNETATEMLNVLTASMATISSTSSILEAPSPLLSQTSQSESQIYEVLTQKSISKSVSLKVWNHGEEIPVIVDDVEVKRN